MSETPRQRLERTLASAAAEVATWPQWMREAADCRRVFNVPMKGKSDGK